MVSCMRSKIFYIPLVVYCVHESIILHSTVVVLYLVIKDIVPVFGILLLPLLVLTL